MYTRIEEVADAYSTFFDGSPIGRNEAREFILNVARISAKSAVNAVALGNLPSFLGEQEQEGGGT